MSACRPGRCRRSPSPDPSRPRPRRGRRRSLTTTLSAPPRAWKKTFSTSFVSIVTLPGWRKKRSRVRWPTFDGVGPACAVEQHRVKAVLALDRVVAVAGIQAERFVAGTRSARGRRPGCRPRNRPRTRRGRPRGRCRRSSCRYRLPPSIVVCSVSVNTPFTRRSGRSRRRRACRSRSSRTGSAASSAAKIEPEPPSSVSTTRTLSRREEPERHLVGALAARDDERVVACPQLDADGAELRARRRRLRLLQARPVSPVVGLRRRGCGEQAEGGHPGSNAEAERPLHRCVRAGHGCVSSHRFCELLCS